VQQLLGQLQALLALLKKMLMQPMILLLLSDCKDVVQPVSAADHIGIKVMITHTSSRVLLSDG